MTEQQLAAMRQALEALELMVTPRGFQAQVFCKEAYDNLRTAIEQAETAQGQEPVDWEAVAADQAMTIAMMKAEQEPVAYLVYDFGAESQYLAFDEELGDMDGCKVTPLYEHPPTSKPWVGLTDAQIGAVAADIWGSVLIAPQSYQAFARAIEAKLKEKNT